MKVSFYRKSMDNNDFWATELKLYRVSDNFPFHLKSCIALDTPCEDLATCVRNFSNKY